MNRRILKLAIPNVISNITVPFVGIVDIALVGRMGSSAYIGGVGFGAIVFTLIYTGLAFLRMGTTGLTAQAYGASNFRETANSLLRALIFALFAAVLLIVLQNPIKHLLILNLKGSEQALFYAAEYFSIRIWAAPATLSVFVFMGWFIGMQNAKIPMIITIIISVSNIIISSSLVLFAGMKIDGVALGTVISQYIGLICSIGFFMAKYSKITAFFKWKSVIILDKVKRFFSVSGDIFIRSILLTGSFFVFNVVSASLGDNVLALNSVMLQFLWFFAYVIDGFSYAGGTLAGRYIGAKQHDNLIIAIKKSVLFGLYIAIAFTLIYFFSVKYIFQALTDDTAIIALADSFKYWIWLVPFASFLAFLYDGIYVGATATATMRNIMIVSVLIIYIPLLFTFKYYWGNQGMWLAMIIMLISRGVGLGIFLKKAVINKNR